MQKLFDQVKELSIADLRILNKFIIETVNAKKDIDSFKIGSRLAVNMEVKVNSPKFTDKIFTVKKINRKKAILTLKGTNMDYDVSFSMIILDK